eukprot:scaffold4827_cov109-Isochrysis_galbana.AAC.21
MAGATGRRLAMRQAPLRLPTRQALPHTETAGTCGEAAGAAAPLRWHAAAREAQAHTAEMGHRLLRRATVQYGGRQSARAVAPGPSDAAATAWARPYPHRRSERGHQTQLACP